MARIRRPRPGLAWLPQAEARGVRPALPIAADGDTNLVPRQPAWPRPVRLASLVLARERVVLLVGQHGERPGGPAGGESSLTSRLARRRPPRPSREDVSGGDPARSAAGMWWDPDMAPVATPRTYALKKSASPPGEAPACRYPWRSRWHAMTSVSAGPSDLSPASSHGVADGASQRPSFPRMAEVPAARVGRGTKDFHIARAPRPIRAVLRTDGHRVALG